MAQKRRGKMTRKQRQRQLHRRMFLTGVLVVLICVGIYSGIRRVAKTEPAMSDALADGSSTQGGLLADDYEDNDMDRCSADRYGASDAEQLVQTADPAEKSEWHCHSLHGKSGKHSDAEP